MATRGELAVAGGPDQANDDQHPRDDEGQRDGRVVAAVREPVGRREHRRRGRRHPCGSGVEAVAVEVGGPGLPGRPSGERDADDRDARAEAGEDGRSAVEPDREQQGADRPGDGRDDGGWPSE